MASNPPLETEDSDEDFFDKLVNDDGDDHYMITSSSSGKATESANVNDTNEARAFANLSISDDGNALTDWGKVGIGEEEEDDDKAVSSISGGLKDESTCNRVDPGQSLVSSHSFAFDNVNDSTSGGLKDESTGNQVDPGQSLLSDYSFAFDNVNEEPNNEIGMVKQSGYHGMGGASVIKEVQWSAFNAPVENGGNDFGSYSDFFTEFGDNFGVQTGKGDNFISSESKLTGDPFHVENSSDYPHQFQENQSYTTSGEQNTDGQDPNSSQYWENLYPGRKYDSNTGQWYQVDGGYDATGAYNSNSASDWTGSNMKTQVSYSQQAAQSYGGSVSDKGTTESVTSWSPVSQSSHTNENFSNWNQASQGNNGYPSHMYFDPQYPGWYYDMNAQEWRSLDEYNSQMTAHAQHQVDQNGFSSTNSYYGNDMKIYGGWGQLDKQSGSEVSGSVSQGQDYNWNGSFGNVNQQGSTTWQRDGVDKSASTSYLKGNQQVQNHYGSNFSVDNNVNQQQSCDYGGTGSFFNKSSQVRNEFPAVSGSQSFVPGRNFSQSFNQSTMEQSEMMNASKGYDKQSQTSYSQQSVQSGIQKSYASSSGRSSAGRPPHALVTFGFGGKLIVMKDATAIMTASYGGQDSSAGSISVLNLAETVTGADASSSGTGVRGYFHTLCRQSFPGPLASGNVSGRELNKWIDERITHPTDMDYRKREVLRLLLSLLKIASQHYGKLRSPFGTDITSKENDAPEVAVARLFASAKKNGAEYGDYGAFVPCLQQLPLEGQTRATAAEVQTLLVSGRKIEALHCAQEGQLWGPALVLAAKLGDQFYVDTIKKMALRQLVAGSPLRTLCLLIAGQPADVFLTDPTLDGGMAGDVNMFQQPAQIELGANGMLEDWEENLAMITANRTKDDELVLIHLGDCLWKETSNIIAAHICYLVAEANFEPYSDSARLCLIGADHWKHPRTYACPEAIQRTEVYEYSKLLGNSQFTLLPFQPYKLIYAHMLAEVGRVSDSLKYCQVISKSLKTGRAPEVEPWRQMVSSLEERIKTHQQGGFSTNLAPGKLVGKLLNLFDSTAHRVVGGLPPPIPSTSSSGAQNDHYQYHQPTGPRVSSSQSTMAMSSLMPSASMEPINQKSTEGNNRRIMHNRSVSEPDFGRSPRQVDSSKENAADSQSKASVTSRFGRFGFGSQLLQKTVGLVLKPRQDKQAKLGETNKFYYNEKLKRWVEEGVDPPAEEAALPPPPTKATFQNGSSDYGSKSEVKSEESFSNGSSEFSSSSSVAHSSGIPPIPSASNQFSARGRMGVRARYVDTFNQGGGNPTKLFQSPSIAPAPKPNPKFFVPMAIPSTDTSPEKTRQPDENPTHIHSFQTPSYQSPMSRFPSMNDISKSGTPSFPTTSSAPRSRRTVSWGGSTDEGFSVSSSNNNNTSEMKPLGDGLGMPPSTFMPSKPHLIIGETGYMPSKPHSINGEMGYGSTDDLHEVEL